MRKLYSSSDLPYSTSAKTARSFAPPKARVAPVSACLLYFGVPLLPPRAVHPWHDIPTGPNPPDVVTAVIEIPTNERNKYELDKRLGLFRLDRVLHSAVHYPGDYGFLPRTLGDDGDPLDVLVLMTIPVFTGCLVDARPIGLFHLIDHGVPDEKVLAVPMRDPYSEELKDIGDIPPHYLREIEHFFQVYKDLEGTHTETRGFEDAAAARAAVLRAVEAYEEKFGEQRR
jgi:inorganic pyrophosphatase